MAIKKYYILLFGLLLIHLGTSNAQTVRINEVMSSNSSTIADMEGSYEDWIEIYNPTDNHINIEGYGLSDKPSDPFRWVFPSYTIEPGGFLLVWASGKDRRPSQGEMTNGLRREVYSNIAGAIIDSLVSHPSFPSNPSHISLVTGYFEAPTNVADYYGQRIHGLIKAPATGNYIFFIAGDDQSHLYLSPDTNPDNVTLIAQVPDWTNSREWGKHTKQKSGTIHLEEGKYYYICALMKEHDGGDNLAVGWQLPNGTLERPISGVHLFWEESELHANFSLKASGEEVVLTNPMGQRVDSIPAVEIPTNVSCGRYPDGSDNLVFFNPATPKESNADEGFLEFNLPPVFSYMAGVYSQPFSLSLLSSTDNSQIYFTLDGSSPLKASAKLYTGPITIEGTVKVRAIVKSNVALPSLEASHIYTRLGDNISSFSSNIPIAIIQQFNKPITPDDRSLAYMIVFDDTDGGSRYSIQGNPTSAGYINANYRGSSSLAFPKKMMGIHLLHENEDNRSEPLLGLPEDHNWILYAPYSDKTLMRNVIAYQLGSDLGRYAPRTKFFELFLHDGNGPVTQQHYHGVYVLTERIKWGEERVDIDRIGSDDAQEPEVTGGYIFKKDRLNPGEYGFYTNRGSHFVYVRPSESDITTAQSQWLKGYINSFEGALFGSNFKDPNEGYKEYIDVGSFIDYHLMIEICKEIDGYRLSTFLHKDRQGKLAMGPLWDFNLSLGNADYMEGWKPEGWYYSLINQYDYLNGWYTQLFKDPEFSRSYKRRWWQLRRGVFSNEHLSDVINSNRELLNESQARNFVRWPTLGRYVWPNPTGYQNRTTYQAEVNWMQNWLGRRLEWMDEKLGPPSSLIHHWHFNELPDGTLPEGIAPDFSALSNASLSYQGSGNGYIDRVDDNTILNAEKIDTLGFALRVRNPSDTRDLILNLPTVGFNQIALSYSVRRTANGVRKHDVFYRTESNSGWVPFPANIDLTEKYQFIMLDFSDIEGVDNNPEFAIKIEFVGDQASGSSGNNRFDNISLEGYSISQDTTTSLPDPVVFYNQHELFVVNPTLKPIDVRVFDISGRLVADLVACKVGANNYSLMMPNGVYIVHMQQSALTWASKVLVR